MALGIMYSPANNSKLTQLYYIESEHKRLLEDKPLHFFIDIDAQNIDVLSIFVLQVVA